MAQSTIIPGMRYREAHAAIDWLCDVLGFERNLVVPDGAGGVAHAQLMLGSGMIMLGSEREDDDRGVVAPTPTGALTQSAYIVVEDIEDSYERVKAAGANIVMELEEQSYGAASTRCETPKVSSGTSAPTIHGRSTRPPSSLAGLTRPLNQTDSPV